MKDEQSMNQKPAGFLHVDVDGLWAIRQCYGAKVGKSFRNDPVWEEGVSNLLSWFDESENPASFFIVGRDLKLKSKRQIAWLIHESGHEIGNHSWSHTIGLTKRPPGFALKEIQQTQKIIEKSGLPEPVGFRAPGYDIDARVLRAVHRCGLRYDASILPTILSPLLRLADKTMSVRKVPGKSQFGKFAYWRAPKVPYYPRRWEIRKPHRLERPNSLIEFPVGVMPSNQLSPTFPLTGSAIFAFGPDRVCAALDQIASEGRSILFLLHGIDGVDCRKHRVVMEKKISAGGFNLTADQKFEKIIQVLNHLRAKFQMIRTCDYVKEAESDRKGLAIIPD